MTFEVFASSRCCAPHKLFRSSPAPGPVPLDAVKEELARRAQAVTHAAARLKEGLDDQLARHTLNRELDALFGELGIEVYQRFRADAPVEDSVVVSDLVDRIAEVEELLVAQAARDAQE